MEALFIHPGDQNLAKKGIAKNVKFPYTFQNMYFFCSRLLLVCANACLRTQDVFNYNQI